MIKRSIEKDLLQNIKLSNVTVLLGARRTGKTFLMNHIVSKLHQKKILKLHGEDFNTMEIMSSKKVNMLRSLVAGYDCIFLDEAQNIPDVGINLKLLVDNEPHLSVFVTGSASFDLRNQLGEPLTGRSRYFYLYPFSYSEITNDYLSSVQQLHENVIYGTYPQVFIEKNLKEKRHIIENIRNGYLLKDILMLDNLKDSLFIINLLKLIAFQIGKNISYNEIAKSLQTSVKTVQRYLDILEKTFVLFSLRGYSRNLRKEISKTPRYYFWDNGIRNAVISNFNAPEDRADMGALWENFCISERIKKQKYGNTFSNFYFWRTYDQQEIDLIEENNENLDAFEFKWGEKSTKVPSGFKNNYPDAGYMVINRENVFEFLM